jgi:hypothetical protein
VLQVFAALPTVPAAFLQGALIAQEPPLPLLVAEPAGLANPAEFWTALGNQLRAALTLTATIAVPVGTPALAPAAITQQIRLAQIGLPATQIQLFRLAGRVTDAGGQPVAGALVLLVEPDVGATTEADGSFRLTCGVSGTFTLRVTAGSTVHEVTMAVPAPAGSSYDVVLPL